MGYAVRGQETVRIGVLFSLSGALSATELLHLQGTFLGIDTVNREGGIDGLTIEPILYDPASSASSYRSMAMDLLAQPRLRNVFGCCSSDIRKSLIGLFERHDALLWYPTDFEGFEWSPNVVYGGLCPNQHTLPLADYLLGRGRGRHVMVGTDFGFSRANNQVFRDHVERRGGVVAAEHYLPRGATREHWMAVLEPYRCGCDAIFSTVVGDDSRALFAAHRALGLSQEKLPITGFCIGEGTIAREPELFAGYLGLTPYAEAAEQADAGRFLGLFRGRFGTRARANWPVLSSYLQVLSFAEAVRRGGSDQPAAIRNALGAVRVEGPLAGYGIDRDTHYALARPHVSVADRRGWFDILDVGSVPLAPDPYLISTA